MSYEAIYTVGKSFRYVRASVDLWYLRKILLPVIEKRPGR